MATNKYIIGPNMMYIFVRLKPISITFILSLVCPISMRRALEILQKYTALTYLLRPKSITKMVTMVTI